MNAPFFSVLVLTYNQENYIAQTLDSIIEQEHDYPYEIIVGEDCSTDGTRDVLLKYKEKYPDIITLILNENNLGMIKNYFNTISRCSGKYIMQCAGDDYWLPGKVRAQIAFMENNPDTGMCCGNLQHLYPNGKQSVPSRSKGAIRFEELIMECSVGAPTVCFRQTLLLKYIEAIDPVNRGWLMEDYPMWLWFAANSKIYCSDDVFTVHRIWEGSVSYPIGYNKIKEFILSVLSVKSFFLNIYKIPGLKEKSENKLYIDLVGYAFKYKQFEEYRIYISKISSRNILYTIKKLIARHSWLFNLYYYYSKTLYPQAFRTCS